MPPSHCVWIIVGPLSVGQFCHWCKLPQNPAKYWCCQILIVTLGYNEQYFVTGNFGFSLKFKYCVVFRHCHAS